MMQEYQNFDKNETTVYLIEAADGVLNGFSKHLSQNALETLTKMGVQVILNSPVQNITKQGIKLKSYFIETPNVMWAAGVSGTSLTDTLLDEKDHIGRVKVNPDLSIPNHPNIFVIGDAAHSLDKNGNPLIGVAPVAMQQGQFLGKLLKNDLKNKPRESFVYTDKGTMATIGRAKAVVDFQGFKVTGFLAWLLWGGVHIFFLIGFRNRFRVFAEWIWHYITFKRGIRLIEKTENLE